MTKDVLLLLAEWLDARRKKNEEPAESPVEIGLFSGFSVFADDGGVSDRDDGDEVDLAASSVNQLLVRAEAALETLIDQRVNAILQELVNQNNRSSDPGYHPCYPERLGRG